MLPSTGWARCAATTTSSRPLRETTRCCCSRCVFVCVLLGGGHGWVPCLAAWLGLRNAELVFRAVPFPPCTVCDSCCSATQLCCGVLLLRQVTGTLLKGYKARFKGAPISSTFNYLKQYVSVSLGCCLAHPHQGTRICCQPPHTPCDKRAVLNAPSKAPAQHISNARPSAAQSSVCFRAVHQTTITKPSRRPCMSCLAGRAAAQPAGDARDGRAAPAGRLLPAGRPALQGGAHDVHTAAAPQEVGCTLSVGRGGEGWGGALGWGLLCEHPGEGGCLAECRRSAHMPHSQMGMTWPVR